LNNSYLGMVKQLQDYYCDHRYAAVRFTDNPDFGGLMKAYGGSHYLVSRQEELPAALRDFLADPGMAMLEARVAYEENVLPMVLGGNSLSQMEGV
jgi:acetolactate synthase-1/2/3 large subunit